MKRSAAIVIVWLLTACQWPADRQIKLDHRGRCDDLPCPSLHNEKSRLVSVNESPDRIRVSEIDVTNGLPGNQGEVNVAVNRNNPLQAVAAIMEPASTRAILVAATDDGGQSWTSQTLPTDAGVSHTADPWLAFDAEGRVYLAQLPVAPGEFILGLDVFRSLDGGFTWEPPLRITSNPTGQDDKLTMAVDDSPTSPFFGNIYVAWKWPPGPVWISVSSDQGESFSPPRQISPLGPSGLDLSVAADGTVLLAFNLGGGPASLKGIVTLRSVDGGQSFEAPVRAATTRAGFEVFPRAHCNPPGAFINASIDADKSSVEDSQRVLLTWTDYPPGSPRFFDPCSSSAQSLVYQSGSTDGGRSWSEPAALPGSGGAQFFQWSDIDNATGAWYVAYKDTGSDPGNTAPHTVLTRSDDHGQTWSEPLTLSSDAGSTTRWPGHYQGMAAHDDLVYVGWADYRNGPNGDLYMGVVDYKADDGFQINDGLTGAWFDPEASGQGVVIEVVPSTRQLVAIWYTHAPDDGKIGGTDHLWLNAVGEYSGDTASLDIVLTQGGAFMTAPPAVVRSEEGAFGSMELQFLSCSEALMSYQLPVLNRSGVIRLSRVAPDIFCQPRVASDRVGTVLD